MLLLNGRMFAYFLFKLDIMICDFQKKKIKSMPLIYIISECPHFKAYNSNKKSLSFLSHFQFNNIFYIFINTFSLSFTYNHFKKNIKNYAI